MKISIIGAGAMGGALAEGLMQSEAIVPSDITIADPSDAALNRFSKSGASITTNNNAATAVAALGYLAGAACGLGFAFAFFFGLSAWRTFCTMRSMV